MRARLRPVGRTAGLLLCSAALRLSAAEQPVTLELDCAWPEGTRWFGALAAAARDAERAVEGRVRIEIRASGLAGRVRVEGDGGVWSGPQMAQVYPAALLYSLPCQFLSGQEVETVRSVYDAVLADGFASRGFELLDLKGAGFTYLVGTRTLDEPRDLRSGRFWLPEGADWAEGDVSLPVQDLAGVVLPLGEVRAALADGRVNLAAASPLGAIVLRWHTRITDVLEVPFSYVCAGLLLRRAVLDRLDDADAAAVIGHLRRGFERAVGDIEDKEAEAREVLRAQGIRFRPATPAWESTWSAWGEKLVAEAVRSGRVGAEQAQTFGGLIGGLRKR